MCCSYRLAHYPMHLLSDVHPRLARLELPRGRKPGELTAAFAARIALKSLHDLVRSEPAWAGCWRGRQALKCAAVAVRLMGRSENKPALRDAVLLSVAGDDPVPAGRCFRPPKGFPPEDSFFLESGGGACLSVGARLGRSVVTIATAASRHLSALRARGRRRPIATGPS